MKKLFLIVGLLLSTVAMADVPYQLDVSKLNQEQRAALQLQITQIAEKKSDPTTLAVTVREEASKWADLGKNVGTALVASAKEVGQGVNEFSQTPVGQITTAIIVYKVVGRDVIRTAVGLLTLVVGTIISIGVLRYVGRDNVVYENIPRLGGLFISRKLKSFDRDTEWYNAAIVISVALVILTWVVGLNILV